MYKIIMILGRAVAVILLLLSLMAVWVVPFQLYILTNEIRLSRAIDIEIYKRERLRLHKTTEIERL